jgi:tryptophan synthase beta chain
MPEDDAVNVHPMSRLREEHTATELPRSSAAIAEPTPHDPDTRGHFGVYGGRFVPEALMGVIEEVTAAYEKARADQEFLDTLDRLQTHYSGRPSPLYETSRLSEFAGGARIYLKREDLNHTGSHKINNVLGQALLAQQMGKTRVIAETGAGQHGVATATACALLGLECVIYMGEVDTPGLSMTPSTRHFVTGSPTPTIRTTASVRPPARIHSR